MKTKDIAKTHGLNLAAFDQWLPTSGYSHKSGFFGFDVDESQDINEIVRSFNRYLAEAEERNRNALAEEQERARNANAEKELAAQEKQRALGSMLITSGFNFDGYTITKYSGYISGDEAVQVDRPTHGWLGVNGNAGEDLLSALVKIRRKALAELKEAAYALGCNAVIGVDFDYLTLDPETATLSGGTLYLPFLFAVTANGNAVVIERNSRTPSGIQS
jgi:uncharacterized protein YbjQ (UPF0145 family)